MPETDKNGIGEDRQWSIEAGRYHGEGLGANNETGVGSCEAAPVLRTDGFQELNKFVRRQSIAYFPSKDFRKSLSPVST